MKFSNGCWLQQEGCECFAPQQAYFIKTETDKVTICAPTNRINHRGDTLGGINLTLIITAPADEVIRVQTYHHLGAVNTYPAFELNADAKPLKVDENEERIIIYSGSLALEIGKKQWYMRYTRNGKLITESKAKDLALMKTDWKGLAYDKGDCHDTYMRQQLSLGVDEKYMVLASASRPLSETARASRSGTPTGGRAPSSVIKISRFLSRARLWRLCQPPGKCRV